MRKLYLVLAALVCFLINESYGQGGLWGMTPKGGTDGLGVIYKTNIDGTGQTVQYNFPSPHPGGQYSQLCSASNGKLYGVTRNGGVFDGGVIYEYDPSTDIYTKRYEFNTALSGSAPQAALVEASNGKLYGLAKTGGAYGGGTLFEFDPISFSLVTRHNFSFSNNEGSQPEIGLVMATSGMLYSITADGKLFEFNPTTNTYTTLTDLTALGGSLFSRNIVQASNGKLYGTTNQGGTDNLGIIFEYNIATNTLQKKYDFNSIDGGFPAGGLVKFSNGKLYGTSFNGSNFYGSIFEYDPILDMFSKKIDFNESTGQGAFGLTFNNNKLYGVTSSGPGSTGCYATLFEYDPITNNYITKVNPIGFLDNYYQQEGRCEGAFDAVLTVAANGKLYGSTSGTTHEGAGSSTLFQYDPTSNIVSKKISFNDAPNGAHPDGSLTMANDGKLYGLTATGGAYDVGVLFEFDPGTQAFTKRFDFVWMNNSSSTGSSPKGGLTLGPNGKLYGLTSRGGSQGYGVLFEFDPLTGTYLKKADFSASLGANPENNLMLASNGKFYGTTNREGANGQGTLFEYDLSTNSINKKYDFNYPNGANFFGRGKTLVEAPNAKLYGMTYSGGTYGFGVIFEFDPSTGIYSKKHDFQLYNDEGGMPNGNLAVGSNGKLYGLASNIIFEFEPSTGVYTKKYQTDYANGSLALTPGGKFYGTSSYGGLGYQGVFFEYDPTTNLYTKKFDFNGNNGASPEYTQLVINPKADQTIVFDPIPPKTLSDPPFPSNAVASSGLPVNLVSSNPAVATINANMIIITGIGNTVITATQPGNTSYNAAVSIQQPLTVIKGSQIITFDPLAPKVYGDQNFTLSATGGGSGNAITFSSSNTSVATVNDNIVAIVGTGTATITASQAGNSSYDPAPDVSQDLVVTKASQSISFNVLPDKTFGDVPFQLTAMGGGSDNLVTFASLDPSVISIADNMATVVGSGSATIVASQAGNANYLAATDVQQIQLVVRAAQTIVFNSILSKIIGDPDFTLSATGGASGSPVTFTSGNTSVATIIGNVVTIVGAGTTTIKASQAGNNNYNAAVDVEQILTINQASQSINFTLASPVTYGVGSINLTATGGASGNPVTFTSSNPSIVSVSGSVATVLAAGSVTITASQAGNNNYLGASDVIQNLQINKANQVITFSPLPDKIYGDQPFNLSAIGGGSGNPVTFVSLTPTVISIIGSTATVVGAGTAIIVASQIGNGNYYSAPDVQQVQVVVKANQTIVFSSLSPKSFGDPDFTLTATGGDSGNPVTFSSSDPLVATISGNMVTITGAGSATITASQAGNNNYYLAPSVQQLQVVALPKPTIPSSYIFLVNEFATQMDYYALPGDGNSRLVVLKKDGPVDFVPTDNVGYSVGQTVGIGNNNFIGLVLSGPIGYGTITNLQPGASYYVKVFEFNQSNTFYSYLTTATATSGQVTMPQETVQVITPANNTTNVNVTTTALSLTTNTITGATQYTIELYTNSFLLGAPITASSLNSTLSATVNYNTQYFVRAKTNLSAGWGPLTMFKTEPAEADAYITAPTNGATGISVNPTITSNTVSGATTYYIEVSTSSDFSVNVLSRSGSSASQTFSMATGTGLTYLTPYFARVKTDLSPAWGAVSSFTTIDALSQSYVTTPTNGQTGRATTLNVVANTLNYATSYTIQLSPVNDFSSGVITSNSLNSPTKSFVDLAYLTTYYTRVSSNLAPGWGPTRSFTTQDHGFQTAPANNATNVNVTQTISASSISGASTYTIEVNGSPTFDPLNSYKQEKIGSRTQTFVLSYGIQYYMRAKCDLADANSWGSTRTFTTGTPLTLAAVTNPANGATVSYATSLAITARLLAGATSYTIELNTASNFSGTSISQSGSSNVLTLSGITASTTYYTRVKTSLDPNWGTTITSFTTTAPGGRVATDPQTPTPVVMEPMEIKVLGNPFQERLSFIVSTLEQKDVTISITDMMGKSILSSTAKTNTQIDIEHPMTNGVYILMAHTEKEKKLVRVIKGD